MGQAVEMLFASELFEFYNDRMVGIMMGDAQEVSFGLSGYPVIFS